MEDLITNTLKVDIDFANVYKICKYACELLNVKNPLFNITIVSSEEIQRINRDYRGKDSVTDVISFAFEEVNDIEYSDVRFLGEIYICYDRCLSQSIEYGHSFDRELCYLSIHGLLHLLGYDHMTEEDKKVMREKEEEILGYYGIER